MQATLNDKVIAEAPREDLIYIEQRWYFPPSSVNKQYLRESPMPYTCPWKGVCQYFDVGEGDSWSKASAFSYPQPMASALDTVKKDFSNYVSFWQEVQVSE